MNQFLVRQVVNQYKNDIPAGIALATSKMKELLPDIESNQLIRSSIEGNEFRWDNDGHTPADWYAFWSEVKRRLEACLEGEAQESGIYTASFRHLEH